MNNQNNSETAERSAEVTEAALLAAMPPVARQMADAVGISVAIQVCQAHGGQRLSIPTAARMTQGHPLADQVGLEAAKALAMAVGGRRIEVPRLAGLERLLRDNALRSDFDAKESLPIVSRRYNVTIRQARRILAASVSTLPRADAHAERVRITITKESRPS